MASLRRTISTRSSTRLSAKSSPYNDGVTLFAIETASESPLTAEERPSKRVKLEEQDHEEEIAVKLEEEIGQFVKLEEDIGQCVQGSSQDPLTPMKKSRKRIETVKSEKSPSKSPRKQKAIPVALKTPHPAPENWEVVYETIREMRKSIVAPVDTMGCDQSANHELDPRNKRFTTLVSLMLSSQTKDEVTDAAMSKLRAALGGSVSIEGVLNADESTISEAIGKVGFWRRKTQYLKQTAIRLRDDFDSDVPKTVDELCSLPGVGPKMAFLTLQVAWNLNHGIGVDVHVHRITNRLGWHKPPTKNPEETRLNLQSWLPTDLHSHINHMLVGFGQVVCLPVGPRCDACDLSKNGLCPSARIPKTKKGRGTRSIQVKSEIVGDEARHSGGPKIEIKLELDETLVMKDEED